MGGHAFQSILGSTARFPRMKPQTYGRLKRYVIQRLQQLQPQQAPNSGSQIQRFGNVQVSVAREDPEKPDFGDLDVVVFLSPPLPSTKPAADTTAAPSSKSRGAIIELPELKELLRAQEAISSGDIFRTFAISAAVLDAYEREEDINDSKNVLKNVTESTEQLKLQVSALHILLRESV